MQNPSLPNYRAFKRAIVVSGPELYEQLVVQIPGLKVVYISGYPINPSIRGGALEDEINYLQKPFIAEALLERIRQVL